MADILMSDAERLFIIHGVQDNFRNDGRGCDDYRHVEIQVGILSNTNGSAKLRLGTTDILVGVKADICEPSEERPDEGRLEFFVDFSANAAPAYEGRGGEDLAQQICAALENTFDHSSCLDLKSLSLLHGKQCWKLNVDILLLQCGGNLLDAVAMAVKSALFDTKIPNIKAGCTELGEPELELSDDPYDASNIDVSRIPTIITVNKIGQSHLVDATYQEETCTLARLYIGVTAKGNIAYLRKEGSGSLDPESVQDMIDMGKRVGLLLDSSLMNVLKGADSKTNSSQIGFL